REVGATNNVDIRSGIMANGRANVIVGASNKGASRIEIFALDTKTGTLEDILTAPINARVEQETYGFCFYQSRRDNSLYAFVTDKSGAVEQWRIGPEGAGLTGTFVRKLRVPSQPEGCVADDANAVLYVGEEDIGIWKFSAEPDAGQEGTLIAQTGHAGADAVLTADVEGLALFVPPGASDTDGFLIASSQGSASYAVFDRAPPHRHRGTFQIAWQGQYTADTDGLDVSAANFGNQFPGGLLVVQDGINAAADRTETYQNFKLAAWADVARELGLNAP
ncbi:MAG: phytase, partial [Pseudomonadota bacterium]